MARGSWAGSSRLADELGLPVVATNNVHYLRADGPPAPRRARLGGRAHGAAGAATTARTPSSTLKPASEMRRLFEGLPRACDATLEIAATLPARAAARAVPLPGGRHPRRRDAVLGAREGVVARARAPLPADDARGDLAAPARTRPHRPMGFPGVLPRGQGDRRLREVAAVSAARAGERRRLDRELRARHHRCRSRSATTCSSSASSTRSAARCPTSTSTSTRPAETRSSTSSTSASATSTSRWSRPCNTMTARSAVRVVARSFGLPIAEVNRLSRHLPWVSARKIREVLATYPECAHHPLRDERTLGHAPRPRRAARPLPDAPRHAPRRLHHHARTDRELDAAAVGGQGHGGLAVRQGRHRGARPREDGHPGPADALGDQRGGRARARASGRGRRAGAVRAHARRPEGLRAGRLGGHGRDVPAREQRAAQPLDAAEVLDVRRHHRADIAVPARPARGRDDHAVHPPPARARAGRRAAPRDGASASPTPTASSSTRSRCCSSPARSPASTSPRRTRFAAR